MHRLASRAAQVAIPMCLWLTMTMGCHRVGSSAEVAVCVGVNDPSTVSPHGAGAIEMAVEGIVTAYRTGLSGAASAGNIVPCESPDGHAVSPVLEIEDHDQRQWLVGLTIFDGTEWLWSPNLQLEPGDPLTAHIRSDDERASAAIVLWQEDALRLAMDGGAHAPLLLDADLPGLAVTDGALLDTYRSGCGPTELRAITFTSSMDSQEVVPYEALRPLAWDGQSLQLVAAQNRVCQGDGGARSGPRMWAAFAPVVRD